MAALALRLVSGARLRRAAVAIAVGAPAFALAHEAGEAASSAWKQPWSFEPWVLVCLAVSLALYLGGLVRLWRHAGLGRGIRRREALAYLAGWLALAAALLSPLDALAGRLFSAHMVQHELLMVVAAPLLVLGRPLAAWSWTLPETWAHALSRFFRHPGWRLPWTALTSTLGAWLLHALVLWGWHLPRLFDAALADSTLHGWQHASFMAGALLFWWSTLGQATRAGQGTALLSLFTTMIHTGGLGALLTLSPAPWYRSYFESALALGVEPLADQQIGGLIMWMPAGFAYFAAGLVLALRWFGASAASGRDRQAPNAAATADQPIT